jgi:hypothetical protein
LAVIFAKIYDAFRDKLVSLRSTYSDFEINIANRLAIGYDNSKDEEDEKEGNFLIYINNLPFNRKDEKIEDPAIGSVERAVQWNTENVIEKPKIIREIAIDAMNKLKELDIPIGTEELIIPIFISVYEAMVNYIKIHREELDEFEYEVNFMCRFSIGVRKLAEDSIYIRPNINEKLMLKDDDLAEKMYNREE